MPPKNQNREASHLWACLLITLFLTVWTQWPWLTNPYAIEEDFRNMYWVHRYQDPSLYPNVAFDRLGVTEYALGSWRFIIEETSPGFSLLLQLGGQLFSPILFHKLLVFPLALAAAFYMYRIGERLSNRRTAFALSLVFITLNLATHTEISVVGGLHRSFVIPLILALAYYLLAERYLAAAVVVFAAGIIYAPILPVLAMTYALSIIKFSNNNKQRRIKIAWFPLFMLALAMLLVVLAISPTPLPVHQQEGAAEIVHILEDPAYQPGGRRPLFFIFPIIGRGGFTSSIEMAIPIIVMFILSALTYIIQGKRAIPLPPVLRNLLLASLIGFGLAWLAIIITSSFLLYVPSRHTQSVFFLVPLIYIAINARQTLHTTFTLIMQNKKQLIGAILPFLFIALGYALLAQSEQYAWIQPVLLGLSILLIGLATIMLRKQKDNPEYKARTAAPSLSPPKQVVLAIALLMAALLYIRTFQANFYMPAERGKSLYAFIETLPKDSLISGHPCLLDSVPFYAKRAVIFSCERFKFLENEKEVVMATLTAYYAENGEDIINYCQTYSIDFLIVNENSFRPGAIAPDEPLFFEPYNELLFPIVQSRSSFALEQIIDEDKIFQTDSIFVIPCQAEIFYRDP